MSGHVFPGYYSNNPVCPVTYFGGWTQITQLIWSEISLLSLTTTWCFWYTTE